MAQPLCGHGSGHVGRGQPASQTTGNVAQPMCGHRSGHVGRGQAGASGTTWSATPAGVPRTSAHTAPAERPASWAAPGAGSHRVRPHSSGRRLPSSRVGGTHLPWKARVHLPYIDPSFHKVRPFKHWQPGSGPLHLLARGLSSQGFRLEEKHPPTEVRARRLMALDYFVFLRRKI